MKHKYSAPTVLSNQRNVCLYMEGASGVTPSHSFENVTDSSTGTETKVLRVRDMPVFRSGSFKDSMGDLTNWETVHIEQMVSNFSFLRDQKIFNDIPVRQGHGSFFGDPMTGLVGYHDAVRSQDIVAPDGNTYRYLLADFSLMTPEAQNAYLSGLWRNRSSEVGFYEDNNGTGYYPVYQGFAFVDIPAVQYLNLFNKDRQKNFSVLLEKEIDMTAAPAAAPPTNVNPDGTPAPSDTPGTPASPLPFTPPTTPQSHAAPSNPPAPAPAAPQAPFTFSCGGQQIHDFAAVQAYITKIEGDVSSLNSYKAEQIRAGRVNYVKGLATDNKILASQMGSDEVGKEDGLIGLALSLTDEQFSQWSATYDALPVNPLFSRQSSGGPDTPENNEKSEDEREYEKYKAQVEWHRAGRMLESNLINTESYKKMKALAKKLGKPEGAEA